MFIAITK